jgi:hypothetical protein
VSAVKPPTPDERWADDYVSSNGSNTGSRGGGDHQLELRMVVLAYITAVAIPPAGFILGIAVATRGSRTYAKHAPRIIALSIIATVVWILVFTSGVVDTNTNDLS